MKHGMLLVIFTFYAQGAFVDEPAREKKPVLLEIEPIKTSKNFLNVEQNQKLGFGQPAKQLSSTNPAEQINDIIRARQIETENDIYQRLKKAQ